MYQGWYFFEVTTDYCYIDVNIPHIMAVPPTNYNIFQIPWGEELLTCLEDMKLLIQQQHGQRFNVPFIIQFSEIKWRASNCRFTICKSKEIWIDGRLLWSIPLAVCDNSSTSGWYLLERSLPRRSMN